MTNLVWLLELVEDEAACGADERTGSLPQGVTLTSYASA